LALKRISYDRSQNYIGENDIDKQSDADKSGQSFYKNLVLKELLEEGLTAKQKSYILLYYRDGLTMEEIAERFGVNRSTVSRTIFRGRERLVKTVKRQTLKRLLKG
jgi:RNA polymerase sigma factor (sigma-70 family)